MVERIEQDIMQKIDLISGCALVGMGATSEADKIKGKRVL